MITLKLLDGSTLHDVRDNDRQVIGYISDAKNAVGTLDFDIYPKHPAYNAIKAGSTKIRAYRDGMRTHDYTVESVTNDLQLKKHVTATDELQYLERIEVPSYKTGVDGVPQTVSGFFMWLVEYYNERSGGERFAFGQIEGDIIDPTITLDRSSDSQATVASIVKDKIIDSLGGYVRVRRVDGVLTIDLKADAAGVCHQYIEFGENLVDYADEQDASELYTAVTAESKYKDDAGDEVTITLADAPDGDYLTGYAKQGDTVTNTVAAAAYGVRRKHLTFDGVKNVYTLVENCEKYIAAHCEPVTTVNVSAADLSTLDSNVQSFDVGLYTRVKAAPMGFDAAFECQSAKRSLNDPTDDKYTLGWTWGSLSSINNRKSVETALGIGKLEQATTEIDQAAKDAAQQAQTAQDVANAATINATNAVTKADSAKEEATSASDTAQRAEAISAEAKQTATQANGVAQDASETASTAAITAGNASATATEAKSTATQTASDLSNYATNTNLMLEDMQGQIDGSITTWFFDVLPTNENAPANEWTTTDLKNNHLGDLYYDTNTGYSYRWQVLQSVYSWQRITDVDVTKALADASKAQDTADAKRRVFYSQPVPPYDKGDLWSQGTAGDMLICETPKTDGMSFLASDWGKASKYTDDTKAIEAEGLAAEAAITANSANQNASNANASAQAAYRIVSNTGSIERTPSGAINPGTLNVAAYHPVNGTQTAYSGRWKIDASADQSTWTALYTSSADEESMAQALAGNLDGMKFVRVSLYAAGGTTTLLQQATLAIVESTGNFLVRNSNGLHVCDTEGDPDTGGALRLASDVVEMLKNGNVLMRIAATAIELGVNATTSVIRLCGGTGEIGVVGGMLVFFADAIGLRGTTKAAIACEKQVQLAASKTISGHSRTSGADFDVNDSDGNAAAMIYAADTSGGVTRGASLQSVANGTEAFNAMEGSMRDVEDAGLTFSSKNRIVHGIDGTDTADVLGFEGPGTRHYCSASIHEFWGAFHVNNIALPYAILYDNAQGTAGTVPLSQNPITGGFERLDIVYCENNNNDYGVQTIYAPFDTVGKHVGLYSFEAAAHNSTFIRRTRYTVEGSNLVPTLNTGAYLQMVFNEDGSSNFIKSSGYGQNWLKVVKVIGYK